VLFRSGHAVDLRRAEHEPEHHAGAHHAQPPGGRAGGCADPPAPGGFRPDGLPPCIDRDRRGRAGGAQGLAGIAGRDRPDPGRSGRMTVSTRRLQCPPREKQCKRMPISSPKLRRLAGALVLLGAALAAAPAGARGYIGRTLDMPVPGGVAVVSLGTGSQVPRASYAGRRVMVIRDSDGEWIALVGIPLGTAPGRQSLLVQDGPEAAFTVRAKEYAAQHIRLKNRRQVTPDPDDLKRIERELDLQLNAYRTYRDGVVPSNVILDRP